MNTNKLINSSEIFHTDMFSSDIDEKTKSIKTKKNLIEISKLINTSEIIYTDMVKS